MINGRMQGIEEVIMMIVFSMYPHRISSMPPLAPMLVMLGSEVSLVVLMMDATIALYKTGLVCGLRYERRRTYTIPKLRRTIRLIFMRSLRFKFQNTTAGNTAKNRSVAELNVLE